MNKKNDTLWYIVAVIIGVGLGMLAFTAFVLASSSTSTTTTTNITTTQILSKFYPLTGVSIYDNVLFYTNTSPTGCISYAVIKNYEYNVTSQSLYLANEIKTTNATVIEKLYDTMGGTDLYGTNQRELLMTINGTSFYVTILQNQTLLCSAK